MALYSVQGPQSTAVSQSGSIGGFDPTITGAGASDGGLGTFGMVGLLVLGIIGLAIFFRK